MNRQVLSMLLTLLISSMFLGLQGQVADTLVSDSTIIEKPLPCLPTLLEASNIRSNTATLNAKICNDKNSTAITDNSDIYFKYTDPTGKNFSVPATITPNGTQLTAKITNLIPDTRYSFSVYIKDMPKEVECEILNFKTLPANVNIYARTTHHRNTINNIASNILNVNTIAGKKYKIVKACDYKSSTVRNKAANIASQSAGNFNIGQVCDIFDYCINNWHYVNDPQKGEFFQSASSSLLNGLSGDCDDFAILICSMLLSVGGDARITTAFKSGSEGHAYAEINIGSANTKDIANYIAARYQKVWGGQIHYRIDRYKDCWLNLDWSSKHPGGKYYSGKHGTRYFILDNYCEDF